MTYSADDYTQRFREATRTGRDRVEEARRAADPITVSDPDELVSIEMTVDLTVSNVTLKPRATRDLDELESLLAATFTEAIRKARSADPALAEFNAFSDDEIARLGRTTEHLQSDVAHVMRTAEAKMSALRARLDAHRDVAQRRRNPGF